MNGPRRWSWGGNARGGAPIRARAYGAFSAFALVAVTAPASPKEALAPLKVAMAAVVMGETRVVEDAWVAEQWSNVERLYDEVGIAFDRRWVDPLSESLAHMETRSDRDALGEHVVAGSVSVFFVQSLRDVDEPERMRMGVCWRSLSDPKRRYVIVASNAKPTVLAHELGHFLGNPHSPTPDNVMSYQRTGKPVFFDDAQKATLRRTALQLLRDGVLR